MRAVKQISFALGLFWSALAAPLACAAVAGTNAMERVIILANAADPDSVRIAEHYARVRQVPAQNIISLKMSLGETTSWKSFVGEIWQPLRDELVARHLIDAVVMPGSDSIGRKNYLVSGHHLAALVICRGVPMRIVHEPGFYTESPPYTGRQEFRTNSGVVDSELGLLAAPTYNINAFVPNPLFENEIAGERERAQVISVGRLDGPSPADALALVDRAVAVEQVGLTGRAYVDIGGIHPEGNRWLENVVQQLAALGFDTSVDRQSETIPATARFDRPALYFGWYATDLNGPFALTGFQFAPGAVALHIHSFSAGTLRSPTIGWTGPFVVRGAAGAVGNVNEPYLNLTHHPDALLRALARGLPLGEAALYALPALSWQTVLVGDPLYRPFAVSVEEQWRNRGAFSPDLLPYLVLRRANLMEREGKPDAALTLLRETQSSTPSLAVGIALADRLEKTGDRDGAVRALQAAANVKTLRTDEWALAREVALRLTTAKNFTAAVDLYRLVFGGEKLPRELQVAWLGEAVEAARAAGNRVQATAWEQLLVSARAKK